MTTGLAVDESALPLVVTSVVGSPTEEQWREMMAAWDAIYDRGQPFAAIAVTYGMARPPSASIRRAIAEWTEARSPVSERLTMSNHVVAGNSLVRGAIRALDWLFKPRTPRILAASYIEALDASIEACRANGLPFDEAKLRATALRYAAQ